MKVWNSIYYQKPYSGSEPNYYSGGDFSWVSVIEDNWLEIRNELLSFLAKNELSLSIRPQYHVNDHGKWKTMPLMTWGVKFQKNIRNFPITTNHLSRIPGLVSASFNLLESKSEINPHFGETNASVRGHLGIQVPFGLPNVGIKVNGITQSWEEGKLLLFCDAYHHSAWNHSNDSRYILLIDVIRPEFIQKRRRICASVLATLFFQKVKNRVGLKYYLTFIPLIILHFFATIFAFLYTPIYNAVQKML